MPVVNGTEIKVVGKSGQISLGKSYAGKTLRVERQEDGSIVLTAVAMIPESQLWTLEEPDRSRIARGLGLGGQDQPEGDRSRRADQGSQEGLRALAWPALLTAFDSTNESGGEIGGRRHPRIKTAAASC